MSTNIEKGNLLYLVTNSKANLFQKHPHSFSNYVGISWPNQVDIENFICHTEISMTTKLPRTIDSSFKYTYFPKDWVT